MFVERLRGDERRTPPAPPSTFKVASSNHHLHPAWVSPGAAQRSSARQHITVSEQHSRLPTTLMPRYWTMIWRYCSGLRRRSQPRPERPERRRSEREIDLGDFYEAAGDSDKPGRRSGPEPISAMAPG